MRFDHPNLGGGPDREGRTRPTSEKSTLDLTGRFGAGESDFSATLRLNVGELGRNSTEKPVITATAVDPFTHELWAGVGDALIHFQPETEIQWKSTISR